MTSNYKLDNILLELQESIALEDMPEQWVNAKFKQQRLLQIDKRGSVGERFFLQTLTMFYPRRIEYKDGDQGDWDLKIGKMRFEIKTASLDKKNKFQYEGLKKNGDYDGILFLGIAPNDLYVFFIKVKDIDFENGIIERDSTILHLHNRGKDGTDKKATGAGYKCNFKIENMVRIESLNDLKIEFEKAFMDEI